ncbi:MAG: caspase family protein, partial [Pseudomonadota bacterium]
MKLRVLVLKLVLIVSLALIPPSAHSAAERRVALVIGNGEYRSAPLRNPPNDAEAMARTLSGLGFVVNKKINADRKTMIQAIHDFGRELRQGGVGLFFYAGHGMQVKGVNYLIPIDANPMAEQEVEFEAVAAERVLALMEAAGNTVNIVILDACRNNPFGRSFRSASRGLARMDAPKGSYVAFATAPGAEAADGTGSNGLFTEQLLKNMVTPGLTLEEVMKRTRVAVAQATGDKQLPWDSSSLMGNFYFVPATAAPSPGVVGPSPIIAPPAPVTPPAPGVVPNYEDLVRQRREAAQQWAVWQGRMDAE